MGSVKAAVLKARGRIRIASTDHSGIEFEITLPDIKAPKTQQAA